MMRLCPKDGTKTEQERCPDCGTATLVLAQNPESRLAEGTEVNGRYRIGKMIGQGGFGAVYRATHLATDQEMAIKVLGVSLDSDESELIQRFFAEAQITAGLKHPNTIRVFDFGQTEGGALYIAMELLNGRDLNEILKERREHGEVMTEGEVVTIASQTLRSLAEAHMAGLVHRDLKPHNIFLNEVPGDDPVVKVLDFGIAKRLGSNLTGTGQAFGTPSYMSPEQAQNRPVDARSDIYSLGVVLYQCICGRCPFEGDNPLAVLLSHVTDAPPNIRKFARTPISEAFAQIVEKALAKDPFDRFESAIAMRKALAALGRGTSTETVLASAGIHAVAGTKNEAFSNTDHGKQLVVEEQIGSEDATAAYNVAARGALSSIPEPGASIPETQGPDAPRVQVEGGPGSGFTDAFMLGGDAPGAESSAETAEPEVISHDRKSNAPKLLAAATVLAVLGLGAFVVAGGGQEAPPVAVRPAADQGTEPAGDEPAEPSADKPADKPSPPSADARASVAAVAGDAGPSPAADAGSPTAPETVLVKLDSKPSGATVLLAGTRIGKTPLDLKVEKDKPLTGKLELVGYHGKEFFVLHTDAPGKTVELFKKVVKVARHPLHRRPSHPSRPARSRSKPKPVRSALEERL